MNTIVKNKMIVFILSLFRKFYLPYHGKTKFPIKSYKHYKYLIDVYKQNDLIKPKLSCYFGKIKYGTPYFNPINFLSSIIYVRKLEKVTQQESEEYAKKWPYAKKLEYRNLPMVRRNKDLIITWLNNDYFIEFGWPLSFHFGDIGWKDKYNTPRFEWGASFKIYFFYWQFCIFFNVPSKKKIKNKSDSYWEQMLWYLYYVDKDINDNYLSHYIASLI